MGTYAFPARPFLGRRMGRVVLALLFLAVLQPVVLSRLDREVSRLFGFLHFRVFVPFFSGFVERVAGTEPWSRLDVGAADLGSDVCAVELGRDPGSDTWDAGTEPWSGSAVWAMGLGRDRFEGGKLAVGSVP